MFRLAGWGLVLMILPACQSPERAALRPIPEGSPPPGYEDLLVRARGQATAAQEFFFRDSWPEVQEAADAIQQTAAHLAKLKSEDVPMQHRATLASQAKELDLIAADLHSAAKAKDVPKTNDAMQRLNLKVRELRVE